MYRYLTFICLFTSSITANTTAEEFRLISGRDQEYGPFKYEDKNKIRIDNRTFRVIRDDVRNERMYKRMKEIMLPEVSLRLARMEDALKYLQELSKKHDKSNKGIRFVLAGNFEWGHDSDEIDPFADPDEVDSGPVAYDDIPVVTFKAREISVLETIKIITSVAQLKYIVRDDLVMVVPRDWPDGPIVTVVCNIHPEFIERIISKREEADSSESELSEDVDTILKEYFQDLGIVWPQGSSISCVPSIGKLMVQNTRDNIFLLDKLISELGVMLDQIEIEFRFLSFDKKDISDIARNGRIGAPSLLELFAKGKGELIAAPKIITQSGSEAEVKGVEEVIYREEISKAGSSVTNSAKGIMDVTREVGVICSVLPELSPEGDIINLVMSPEYVEGPDGQSSEKQGLDRPTFYSQTFLATVNMYNEETIMIGGGVSGKDPDKMIYVFVTAQLIDPEGKAIRRKESLTWEEE